jgi:hypothetical protein
MTIYRYLSVVVHVLLYLGTKYIYKRVLCVSFWQRNNFNLEKILQNPAKYTKKTLKTKIYIWGSHVGEDVVALLGNDAVWTCGYISTFRPDILPPSSWLRNVRIHVQIHTVLQPRRQTLTKKGAFLNRKQNNWREWLTGRKQPRSVKVHCSTCLEGKGKLR